MRRRRGLVGSALVLGLAIAGCASSPPAPDDQYYRLLVEDGELEPVTQGLDGALLVRRFAADGLLDQRGIAFAEAGLPQALKQYHYHLWSAAPPRMLQDFAVDYLRAARISARVVSPEVGIDGDFELVGRIRRFEHLRESPGAVAVSLELGLVRAADSELLLLRSYQVERPTESDGVVFAVRAINAAVNAIFARFVRDLQTMR